MRSPVVSSTNSEPSSPGTTTIVSIVPRPVRPVCVRPHGKDSNSVVPWLCVYIRAGGGNDGVGSRYRRASRSLVSADWMELEDLAEIQQDIADELEAFGAKVRFIGSDHYMINDALDRWQTDEDPRPTMWLWLGHGEETSGTYWLITSKSKRQLTSGNVVSHSRIEEAIRANGVKRALGDSSLWAALVIDCCQASTGTC